MAEYLSARVLGDLFLTLFLILPLIGLASLCVLTLRRLPAQRRKGLLTLFIVLLTLSVVLFGGAWVLDRRGLAWRTWFQEGMSFVLWLTGLVTGIAAVGYVGRWLAERGSAVKAAVSVLSVFCLVSAMFVGTVLGGLWCLGPGEQVVTYQGEKMILGKWTWMGTSYQLYEYHGPLVRSAGPAVVDFRLIDVEGAVIDW